MNKSKLALVIAAILFVVTPYINTFVNVFYREKSAFGGECLFFLIPFLIYGFVEHHDSMTNYNK